MRQIKVIKNADEDFDNISKEEREILFQRLAEKSSLDEYHFTQFRIGEEEQYKQKQTILTLKARQVASHPLIKPIVDFDYVKPTYQYVKVHIDESTLMDDSDVQDDVLEENVSNIVYSNISESSKLATSAISPEVTGGKVIQKVSTTFNEKEVVVDKKLYNLNIQLKESKYIKSNGLALLKIAAFQDFPLIGFDVNDIIYPTRYGKYSLIPYSEQIHRGILNYPKNITDFKNWILKIIPGKMFASEDDAKAQIDKLLFILEKTDIYYHLYPQIIISILVNSAVCGKFKYPTSDGIRLAHGFTTANSVSPAQKPESIAKKMLDVLDSKTSSKTIIYHDYIRFISELKSKTILHLYEHAVMHGIDAMIKDAIEQQRIEDAKKLAIRKIQIEADVRFSISMHYMSIIQDKFGDDRAREIHIKRDILAQLKPRERSVVENEYAKQKKSWSLQKENTCEHLVLEKKFRQSESLDLSKMHYKKLLKFIDKQKKNDAGVYMCKNCNFSSICPHVVDEFDARLGNKSIKEIRSMLIKKYAGHDELDEAIFCKICGENMVESNLMEAFEYEDTGGLITDEPQIDELKTLIYNETSYLIYSKVQFKAIVNVKYLIGYIVDNIYNSIYDLQVRLLKAKTNTDEVLADKLQLYSSIFAMANIIHLIRDNFRVMDLVPFDKASPSKFEGQGKGPKSSKLDMQVLFKNALATIMTAKIQILRKNNITSENLLIILKRAYLSISKTEEWQDVHMEDSLEENIFADPVYQYIYKALHLFEKKPPENYKALFGNKNDEEIEKVERIYDVVHLPNLSLKDDLNKKAIDKSNYEDFLVYIWKLSFDRFMQNYLRNYLFTQRIYDNGINQMFLKKDTELMSLDAKLAEYHQLEHSHMFGALPFQRSIAYDNKPVNLAHLYDKNGNRRKWDILVFSLGGAKGKAESKGSKGKKIELTKKEIGAIYSGTHKMSLAEFQKLSVVDKKSSQDGELYSTVKIRGLEEILDSKDDRENFYRYYTYRCPEGDEHLWKNNICSNCTLVRKEIDLLDKGYYKKYYNKYVNRQREQTEITPADKAMKVPDFVTKWKYRPVLIELSKISGVKQNILQNLGLVEDLEYDNIISGKLNPSGNHTPNHWRLVTLRGYISILFQEYNMFRLRSSSKIVPVDIQDLYKKSVFKAEDLPVIGENYRKYINIFSINPESGSLFCLETLCESILSIYKNKHSSDFAKYILAKIVKKDELTSKPVDVNLEIVKEETAVPEYERDEDASAKSEEEGSDAEEEGVDYEEDEDHEDHGDY